MKPHRLKNARLSGALELFRDTMSKDGLQRAQTTNSPSIYFTYGEMRVREGPSHNVSVYLTRHRMRIPYVSSKYRARVPLCIYIHLIKQRCGVPRQHSAEVTFGCNRSASHVVYPVSRIILKQDSVKRPVMYDRTVVN